MEYIYFELNDRKLKINKENSEDIWIWKEIKNPFWRRIPLNNDKDGYFVVRIGEKQFRHHRAVFYAHNQDWDINFEPRKNMIDHKDHNKQNNLITNLRLGTNSLNQQHRHEKYVKGYSWAKDTKKWQASIRINNKLIYLGQFEKEEDARQAYLKAKELYHEW